MNSESLPERSTFVTVVAWVFIVLAGMTTLIGIAQNLMIHLLFPIEEMQQQLGAAHQQEDLPWVATFMMRYFPWFFGAILAMASGTLIASIALLRRHNWARLVFIGLMVVGIGWNVVGMVMQFFMLSMFADFPASNNDEFDTAFQFMQYVVIGITFLFAVGLSGLFGWIAWRLRTPEIVQEFKSVRDDG